MERQVILRVVISCSCSAVGPVGYKDGLVGDTVAELLKFLFYACKMILQYSFLVIVHHISRNPYAI